MEGENMDTRAYAIGGDDFRLDTYRHQEFWSWKIAFAFFFGDVGGGLFLFSSFYEFHLGMLLGWIMVTVFKPIALFMHLGKPARFWRAAMNPGKSWITRGLLASVLFSGFGFIHLVNNYFGILPGALSAIIYWIAILSSVGVIIYLGFVLSYSPSIRLWNTGLMPIMCLNYGFLGGVTLLILLGYSTFDANTLHLLKVLELCFVLFGIVLMLSFLHGVMYSSNAGRRSVQLLLKQKYAVWFVGAVIGIGLLLTAFLIALESASLSVLLTIAVAELIGDIGFKITLFKAATFEPVMCRFA